MEKPNVVRLPLGICLAAVASLVLTASVAGPGQFTPSRQAAEATASVTEPVHPAPSAQTADARLGPAREKMILGPPVLVDMRIRRAGPVPMEVRWQYINGADAFNTRLDARLLAILDAHAGGRHDPSAHGGAAANSIGDGVTLIHEVVLAAGAIVGSRLVQATVNEGRAVEYSEEVTYEDLSTGVASGSASLIDPEKVGGLRDLLRTVSLPAALPATDQNQNQNQNQNQPPASAAGELRTPPAEPPPASEPTAGTGPIPDDRLLSAVTLTPAGDVSITVGQDPDTGARLSTPQAVTLSSEATNRVLSAAGQALRQQVITGTPFNAPEPSGVAHINCDIVACAALTYDDGPNAQTARLLEVLAKHNVKATFFAQGAYVQAYPQVARSVAAAGHTIANHTMSHPYLTKLSSAGIAREVQGAQAAIETATGVVPAYLRPPYGATNASVAASVGLPQVLWDVDSMDWQSRNKAVYIPRILGLVKPGSVILQHDVHGATVDGQDELIAQLHAKGYYLVTLPQLFAGIDLKPEGTYKCRGTAPGCTPGR